MGQGLLAAQKRVFAIHSRMDSCNYLTNYSSLDIQKSRPAPREVERGGPPASCCRLCGETRVAGARMINVDGLHSEGVLSSAAIRDLFLEI